jgi:archaellum biogenesis ATPase FlaH
MKVRITDEPMKDSGWSIIRAIDEKGKVIIETVSKSVFSERALVRGLAAKKGYEVIEA